MYGIDDGLYNQVRVRHRPGIHISEYKANMYLSSWDAVNNLAEFIDSCAYSRLQLKLLSATSTRQEDVIFISSKWTQGLCHSSFQLLSWVTKTKSRHQASTCVTEQQEALKFCSWGPGGVNVNIIHRTASVKINWC